MNLDDYITVAEFRRMLGVAYTTAIRIIEERRIRAFKFAGQWMLERSAAETFASQYDRKAGRKTWPGLS